ncbi:MAG: hypothetical protein H7222_02185 [Methylotenera sp.]|nr:hypothetical protein [Oligoflexia bacterium]
MKKCLSIASVMILTLGFAFLHQAKAQDVGNGVAASPSKNELQEYSLREERPESDFVLSFDWKSHDWKVNTTPLTPSQQDAFQKSFLNQNIKTICSKGSALTTIVLISQEERSRLDALQGQISATMDKYNDEQQRCLKGPDYHAEFQTWGVHCDKAAVLLENANEFDAEVDQIETQLKSRTHYSRIDSLGEHKEVYAN